MRTTRREPNTYRANLTRKERRAFRLHKELCVGLDEAFREALKPALPALQKPLTRAR